MGLTLGRGFPGEPSPTVGGIVRGTRTVGVGLRAGSVAERKAEGTRLRAPALAI